MKYAFDLQRFAATLGVAPENLNVQTAYAGGDMATATFNTALEAVANKAFYEGLLLDEAGPHLVHNQFGQKASVNRAIAEWRKYNALSPSTTPLTEGVTPDGSGLSATAITANVRQYGNYVTTSDFVNLVAIDPIVSEATKVLGNAAGISHDLLTRNVLVAGTNVMYAGGASSRSALTASNTLTRELIVKGVRQLERKNAPKIDGSYVLIVHPDNVADLLNSTDFIDVQKYADKNMLFTGELGKVSGARIVVSTQTKVWKGGDTEPNGLGVYGCLLLGANAYGTVELVGGGMQHFVKPLGSGGSADPINQRATVGYKFSHAAKILNENYLVRLECCSDGSGTIEAN